MLLINRKDMSLVFKHRDKAVCEAERVNGNAYVFVDETEENGFRGLTSLEMKILYRNLGHVPGTALSQPASVKNAVLKLLRHRLDNYPANKDEIELFVKPATPTKSESPVAPQQAPKGGTSNLIWDVADEMWRDSGMSKDVKEVLSLRKRIMQELETAHGVKRNTASNELGKWQKSRI